MMVDYGLVNSNQLEETAATIQIKSNKYRYSKYLVMKLLTTMESAKKEVRNEVVKDFYLYASSQATYSAPYIKLE
jgi:hypothetical protein